MFFVDVRNYSEHHSTGENSYRRGALYLSDGTHAERFRTFRGLSSVLAGAYLDVERNGACVVHSLAGHLPCCVRQETSRSQWKGDVGSALCMHANRYLIVMIRRLQRVYLLLVQYPVAGGTFRKCGFHAGLYRTAVSTVTCGPRERCTMQDAADLLDV